MQELGVDLDTINRIEINALIEFLNGEIQKIQYNIFKLQEEYLANVIEKEFFLELKKIYKADIERFKIIIGILKKYKDRFFGVVKYEKNTKKGK